MESLIGLSFALRRGLDLEVGGPRRSIFRALRWIFRTIPRPGDFGLFSISLATVPPTPVPPFGVLEINAAFAATLGFALADANATMSLPVAIPANPALVGTYAFQALSGDAFRPFLSNGATLTVTP